MYSWLEIAPLTGLLPPSPLLGYCPPLDMEDLKATISQKLKLNVLSLEPKWQYSLLDQAKSRLPIDNHRFNYALARFNGLVEVYFSRSQLGQIARRLLGPYCPLSESSKEAILDFFVSTLMVCFVSKQPLENLQPRLVAKTQQIKSKKILEGVIEVNCEEGLFHIHLLIEDSIYHAWLAQWAQTPYLGIAKETAEKLQIQLQLQLGEIPLVAGQLSKLQVGDWISLKEIGLKESMENSQLTLTLGGQKLGTAHLKKGQVLIASRDEFFDRLKAN
jgi:hypothetical protein